MLVYVLGIYKAGNKYKNVGKKKFFQSAVILLYKQKYKNVGITVYLGFLYDKQST